MYVQRKRKFSQKSTDGGYKRSIFVCGLGLASVHVHNVCAFCVIKRFSALYRSISVVLQGYRNPDMSCLIQWLRVQEKRGRKKTTNYCEMYTISASMSTSQLHLRKARRKESYSDREREKQTDGASGDSRRYQTSPLIAIYYDGTIVSCGPC